MRRSEQRRTAVACRALPTSSDTFGAHALRAGVSWGWRGDRMSRDFFDPPPEEQQVVLIDAVTLHRARALIESCEHCNPVGSEIPFDQILDQVTGPIRA